MTMLEEAQARERRFLAHWDKLKVSIPDEHGTRQITYDKVRIGEIFPTGSRLETSRWMTRLDPPSDRFLQTSTIRVAKSSIANMFTDGHLKKELWASG